MSIDEILYYVPLVLLFASFCLVTALSIKVDKLTDQVEDLKAENDRLVETLTWTINEQDDNLGRNIYKGGMKN